VALSDLRLAILTLAQRWTGSAVDATIVLIPSGDPLLPLFPAAAGTAPFAGTAINLRAAAIAGLDAFPSVDAPSTALTLPAPSHAVTVFTQLKSRFAPVDTTAGPPQPAPPATSILKTLPNTYLAQLPPGRARSAYVASADEFGCTMRTQKPSPLPPQQPDPTWGAVISHALRNPALADALGLRYTISVPLGDVDSFANGGWLFVTLDSADGGTGYASAWNANPDAIKIYAARLPALNAPAKRAIFTAVLFPVANPNAPAATPDQALLDTAILEAERYDDGFAKLVHARQPDTLDAHVGDGKTNVNPATDIGIQIGWDDEQVLEWHNRQIQIAQAAANNQEAQLESPLGVMGYRIDVREPVPGESPAQRNKGWVTLMAATGTVPPPLDADVQNFDGELTIEPTASAPTRDAAFWLPLYFANWRGTSLGVRDDTPHLLAGGTAAGKEPPVIASQFSGKDVPPLLYGKTYEFRVRLADIGNGGPQTKDLPLNETVAERAAVSFARFTPPKGFGVTSDATPQAPFQPTQIVLRRPIIGYPEALFTPRYGTQQKIAAATRSAMLAQLGLAPDGSPLPKSQRVADHLTVGVPDPDVKRVEIVVEVRALAHDTASDVSSDGAFTAVYKTTRGIPPLDPIPFNAQGEVDLADVVADVAISPIVFDYVDVDDVSTLSAPAAGPIPIPTARDVRLSLTPIADSAAGYFGTIPADAGRPDPTRGVTSHVLLRAASQTETTPLFAPLRSGKPSLEALFFQPSADGDPVAGMMALMADALDLDFDGLTLRARAGERIIFGASNGFKNTIGPDGSTFTFATAAEVFRKWTVVLQYQLARDWTWDGVAGDSLDVQRGGVSIGQAIVTRIASAQALANVCDRTTTRAIFIDGIDPAVADPADGFTDRPPYVMSATIPKDGGGVITAQSGPLAVRLPVAIPPAGVPKLLSAGYALSPYEFSENYSSTEPRARNLWLEFESPPETGDGLFARVLAYAPDPVLYVDRDSLAAQPPPEPALKLDPESIRTISPKQPRDEDGVEAMLQLHASQDDPRKFLLTLPEGVASDDPQLFGMWTYEFRFGHIAPWSTAHGRFGRPLRTTGVQHPAPSLTCAASWRPFELFPLEFIPEKIAGAVAAVATNLILVATAPYATPVQNGRRVGDGFPRTTIGFLLYAQARQADDSGYRNVLLAHRGARPVENQGRFDYGEAVFAQQDVLDALNELGLPANSNLSVLAVEFYPPGGTVGAEYNERFAQVDQGAARQGIDPFSPEVFGRRRILRTSPLSAVQPVC